MTAITSSQRWFSKEVAVFQREQYVKQWVCGVNVLCHKPSSCCVLCAQIRRLLRHGVLSSQVHSAHTADPAVASSVRL